MLEIYDYNESDNYTNFATLKNEDNEKLITLDIIINEHELKFYQEGELIHEANTPDIGLPDDMDEWDEEPKAPNCDNLGPRQTGESYGDCFSRNMSNFCCDFTGCAAMIICTPCVGIATGIACLMWEEMIYEPNNISGNLINTDH